MVFARGLVEMSEYALRMLGRRVPPAEGAASTRALR